MNIVLHKTPGSTFSEDTGTTAMAAYTAVWQFLDNYGGIPDDLRAELDSIRCKMKAERVYRDSTLTTTGTTLAEVEHLLSPASLSQLHIVLAMNYYGLCGCRP